LKKKTKIDWPKPLDWKQTGDHDWTVPGVEEERHTRIHRSTNRWLELDYDSYSSYRRGRYCGTARSLKQAKKWANDFRSIGDNDNGAKRT
jgi:hypothetical protein